MHFFRHYNMHMRKGHSVSNPPPPPYFLFLQRTLQATLGETSKRRRGGAHMGFSERIDTILN